MSFFRVIRRDLAFLGIDPNRPSFNVNSKVAFLVDAIGITLSILFLVVDANTITFLEYTHFVIMSFTIVHTSAVYALLLFQTGKLFKLMDDMEIFYGESKWLELFMDL